VAAKVGANLSRQVTCGVCGKPMVAVWIWDGKLFITAACAEHADEVRRVVVAFFADERLWRSGKFVRPTDEGSDGS